MSGAVGWLTGCAALSTVGVDLGPVTMVGGAAVSTGFALLPDIDHSGSTVARTLGPVTRFLASGVSAGTGAVKRRTCAHCGAGPEGGGHRTVTHTAAGAVLCGLVVAAACAWLGERAGLVVVGFAVWLGAHSALSSKWRARIGDMVLPGRFRRHGRSAHRFTAGVGALLLAVLFAAGVAKEAESAGWWWLGLPAGWGCLVHTLGDGLTYSRVPLWWPLRIRGCRWAAVGSPRWLRFRTGSRVESGVVVLMVLMGFVAIYTLAI